MTNHSSKRRRWKTALNVAAFLMAAALSLAVLAAALLSWAGRRDWARVKADLTARGEALSLAELIPPPIPDAQNFFADPMWDELADLVDSEENGLSVKRPRLPKGQRQLDAFDRPLTPEERETLRVAFPEFAVPDDATIMGLVHATFKPMQDNQAPESEKAAQFLLAVSDLAGPMLARLHALADRPGARFPLNAGRFIEGTMDRTNYQMRLAQFFRARIWAEATLGKTDAATRDLGTALRVSESLANEPLLISLLIRLGAGGLVMEALETALMTDGWTDPQLADLESRLASVNYPAGMANALRGERGFGNALLEELQQKPEGKKSAAQEVWSGPLPATWLAIFGAGDVAIRNQFFQNWIDALDATPGKGLNARTFSVFERDRKFFTDSWWNRFRYPVTGLGMPNLENIAVQGAKLQDQTALARTVCALRRYHLAQGVYPADLNALVPAFLPAVPTNISTLRPLLYRREGTGFRLWAPGWNERDEGGEGDDIVWGEGG
jgi:hypothetical protein